MPKRIQIFDPQLFANAIPPALPGYDEYASQSPNESERDRVLSALANDARGGYRDLVIADRTMIARISALRDAAPNLAEAANIVIRAAELSRKTKTPMSIPAPLALIGEPGVGKSWFARRLAEILGSKLVEHSMASADDSGILTGRSASWRGSRVGKIARSLIDGDTASPVFFIDEVDKAMQIDRSDSLEFLHVALEPENAKAFADQLLELPMRADFIIWILTANDTSSLKKSLLDRMLTITIPAPRRHERETILAGIFVDTCERYGGAVDKTLDGDVIAAFSDATPRQMRILISLALGFAFDDGRRRLNAIDVRNARDLLEQREKRTSIGFLQSPSRP